MSNKLLKNPGKTVWYEDGLRFTCTRCGKCCRDREVATYVFLEEDDIRRLADFFDVSRSSIIRRYCVWDEDGYVFKKRPGSCTFYDENQGCLVYPARPAQCRTWPFWPSNLRKENWEEAAEFCPGCNKGKLRSRREIESSAMWMIGRRGEGSGWPGEIPFPV